VQKWKTLRYASVLGVRDMGIAVEYDARSPARPWPVAGLTPGVHTLSTLTPPPERGHG
jgi:hypothetical protein